jgi:hypothetical protein
MRTNRFSGETRILRGFDGWIEVEDRITGKQHARVLAVAKDHGVPMSVLPQIVKNHGFAETNEITQDQYDAVVADIEKWKAPTSDQVQIHNFASSIRAKFPGAYDDMDDATLAQRIVAKYPQCSDMLPKPIVPGAIQTAPTAKPPLPPGYYDVDALNCLVPPPPPGFVPERQGFK